MRVLLALLPAALASADQVQVTLSLDDRTARILSQARVEVDQEGVAPAPFVDDGSLEGDVAGDRIWLARTSLRKAESVTLQVWEGSRALGSFPVFLPSSESVAFAFRTRSGSPALLMDVAAEVPRIVSAPTAAVQTPQAPTVAPPLVATAVEGAADASLPPDQVRLTLLVDDRKAQRLGSPRLALDEAGATPTPLVDDGSVADDAAGDHQWVGRVEARRAQYVRLLVTEGDEDLGSVTVFLPAASTATVNLRTLPGSPALAADVPLTVAPSGTSATPGSTGARGGFDAFAATLWVLMAFLATALAWARSAFRRAWLQEVRPFMARVEAHIARNPPYSD